MLKDIGNIGSAYMGGSYRCIVACAQLGNGAGCKTASLAALLSHCGPAKDKARLHNKNNKIDWCVTNLLLDYNLLFPSK